MDALQYVFYLLLTLGILVTAHEYGHYLAARASGVRILRFSVGFGRALWTWKDRRGTEFAIAAIPLGGYLRMLESGDKEAAPGDLTFDQLPPLWRIAIAAAGPAANFLLAFAVYVFIAVMGVTAFLPVISAVAPGSPAHDAGLRAGEEVVSIDGRTTPAWADVGMSLAARLGDTGDIRVDARWPGAGEDAVRGYAIAVRRWNEDADEPDLLASLGLSAALAPLVGEVIEGSAAQDAGLARWDRIAAVNGAPIASWSEWVEAVRAAPGQALSVRVARDGGEAELTLTPESAVAANGERIGFAGVAAPVRTIRVGLAGAVAAGARDIAENTLLTLSLFKKMILGLVSPKNLSSPIMIAKVAKDSADAGWRSFLGILALLSISLGVVNLLPIPILDGGHILFAVAELATRRPVSARMQAVGMRMGLFVVACMMLLAIYNDVTRFL